ncbi:MAG: DUF3482 domain-containing protein, partial [Planctomycetota bacterium]
MALPAALARDLRPAAAPRRVRGLRLSRAPDPRRDPGAQRGIPPARRLDAASRRLHARRSCRDPAPLGSGGIVGRGPRPAAARNVLRAPAGGRAQPRARRRRTEDPGAVRLDGLDRRPAPRRPLGLGGADQGEPAAVPEHPGRTAGRRRAPESLLQRRPAAREDSRPLEAVSPGNQPPPPRGVPVSDAPEFVVVGRVNKGKSSIVATLAEEESVPISDEPGTTTESRAYSVQVDGQVLFTLVDTPGFQDAPAALEQIRKHRADASVSDAAVRAFVDTYRGSREFAEESRLLAPILKGGRILYVVDGTVPYSSDYEAEMEILRWTGRPRMALVNRIGAGNHIEEWKKALGQYFSIVREFDANRAGFDDRIRLLESFRVLDDGARASLDRAIGILRAEQARRRRESARVIASLLATALAQRVELQLKPGEHERDRHGEALEALQNQLRDAERRAHGGIFELYRFRRV